MGRLNHWWRLAIVATGLFFVIYPPAAWIYTDRHDRALNFDSQRRCLDAAIKLQGEEWVRASQLCTDLATDLAEGQKSLNKAKFHYAHAVIYIAIAWIGGLVALFLARWILAGRKRPGQ